MKQKFAYCFEPRGDDLESIWKKGILTVDTNVLLDLYRYHENTRDSIVSNLEKFEGELWLSNQAASEFFRNRKKVITSSEKTFKDALTEADNLSKNLDSIVNKLKGNRIIPNTIADELKTSVESIIENTKEKIKNSKDAYPKYLENDPILEKISNLFNGKIGKEPLDIEGDIKQAEKRIEDKTPPGYKDSEKDDDRPYGDYLLWKQSLDHSKETGKPLILVTSERKEDWWEIIQGKTVGPRPELLKEAKESTGNHVLIYQTESFIKIASKRYGEPANISVIDEIIAVGKQRTKDNESAIVLINHTLQENTSHSNQGIITVELKREVKNFTVSRGLVPNLESAPTITASLLASPNDDLEYKVSGSTGTVYDFNIHIYLKNQDTLPIGVYEFKYIAESETPEMDSDFDDLI
ncbi:DUF4935 domain-containing protein [Klebsiella pneumoniae]|uniref:PIN-like domain-containing protein n=1 Tax=Klebsiella pneumoniae TaxID=573 RepID=UPI001D0A74AB|nr:PIN domain-containing protein [Klebsiella pneumoniae]MCB8429968.1 DUF4935 domain-containing protein [Klebsiella pneumoniae]HDH0544292.1 DUF4935 domain-containing protein [Klebsiella pneumoniae]